MTMDEASLKVGGVSDDGWSITKGGSGKCR